MVCAIETIHLTKRYPQIKRYRDLVLHPLRKETFTALQDVTLRLESGQVAGLLGPNGAGKTTLIKILCTLVYPSEGKAFVQGLDVGREGRKIRGRIGLVVSEERSFYWRLTGRQNLEFFSVLNNLPASERRQRVSEVLHMVGMEDHAGRLFKDYSSGMKQRLAIARAMLTDPQIIFMDEPTKTLDPLIARNLRELIRDVLVGEQGRTVVFATNNIWEGEALFDHVTILDQGRIKASGPAAALRDSMDKDAAYVVKVRCPLQDLRSLCRKPMLESTALLSERTGGDDHELVVRLTSDGLGISDVIEHLVTSGVRIRSCTREKPSLGDIFERFVQDGMGSRA